MSLIHDESIKVLLIEDNPGDARLIRELLKDSKITLIDLVHEERLGDGLQRLDQEAYDVLLLDLMLPDNFGLDTFVTARMNAPDLPIVLLTSIDDEAFALEAVRYGAQDYLVKGETDSVSLIRTLRYAIARKQAEEEIRRRTSHQEAINAIIAAGAVARELDDLLENVLDHMLQALSMKRGGIWLDDGICAIRGLPKEMGVDILQALGEDRQDIKAPVVNEDWESEGNESVSILTPIMTRFNIRSSLIAPIMAEEKAIGMVIIASPTPRGWPAEEIALAEAVGQQLGIAVERLVLQEKTREQAAQLQGVLDTVQEGILTLDPEGRIILANPAARQYLDVLTEIGEDKVINSLGDIPLQEFFIPQETGLPHEITIAGPPQHVFEVYVNAVSIGSIGRSWTLLIRDVTEVRQAQKRVYLQERLAAVGQLAAGIAHDFNNILGTIILFSQLLLKGQNLRSQDRERLAVILKQSNRAAYLISQILDFSRKAVMERRLMDLVPFLKEVKRLFVRTLPENIRIELLVKEERFIVNADPARMQQVFMNLTLNARDAMPEGGELRFELSYLQTKPDEPPPFRDMSPGEWVRIDVSDTGAGISPEILPHIFEPFFTTKPLGEGTGLGLAQVYGIVKQHDGYIDVISEEGKGTFFIIYLPIISERVAPISIPDEMHADKGLGETILVVEDDEPTRQAVSEILESLNYSCILANDGREAMKILKKQAGGIDLVLSDLVMRSMSGIALYQKVKEMCPQVPFVIMTGYPLDSEMRDRLEKQNVTWLQKPLTLEKIARMLNKTLARDE